MEKEIHNRIHKAKFKNKIEIQPNVFEVYFTISDNFNYNPGQYAWLQLPNIKYKDTSGDRRAFSILNTPNPENVVSFLFRRGKSNFKKSVLELSEGDEVNIIGPFGSAFAFPDDSETEMVLISGGVGLSPFMNFIRHSQQFGFRNPITLFSFMRDNEKFYEQELKSIKNNIFNYTVINEKPDLKYFKKIISKKALFYISGSQVFVDEVYSILIKLKIDYKRMRFENFYPTDKTTLKLEELLKKEMERGYNDGGILFSAIKSSSHHVLITDKNGKIIFANQAAQNITGYSFEEMKGNTPRLWGGLMSDEFYRKLWYSKMSGDVINEELVNKRKNGDIYYVISHISPIIDESGKFVGFIATEEDITEIKNKDKKIQKTNEELERFTSLMAGRELKMIELKNELKELKSKINEK